MSDGATPALWLDHASIAVPHLGRAVDALRERLGLDVTVTPQAPERHGRIHLDRAYLEVATNPGSARWDITHLFLRYADPAALGAHLDDADLRYRYQVYEGADGRWEDIELDVGDVSVPILVRRTAPAEVARDWPPPLDRPHRCGALTLAAVHVPVASIEAAAQVYARLLAVEAPPVLPGPGPNERHAIFPVGPGTIVLNEGGGQRAVVLGVASLDVSRAVLGEALRPVDASGVAWLDAAAGLAIGFAETRSPPGRRAGGLAVTPPG